jgi:hypothetical protein
MRPIVDSLNSTRYFLRMRFRETKRTFVAPLATFICVAACSSPAPNTKSVSAIIGGSGGALTSSDGMVTLTVPAGALSSNVTIIIGLATGVPSGIVSQAYEIGPTGTTFAVPATLTMPLIGGLTALPLAIATVVNGQWSPLATEVADDGLSAQLEHLSPYAVIHESLTGAGGTGGDVSSKDSGGDGAMAGSSGAAGAGATN